MALSMTEGNKYSQGGLKLANRKKVARTKPPKAAKKTPMKQIKMGR